MNVRFLEAFVWVAELGGFKAAAEKMHTTQAGISNTFAINFLDDCAFSLPCRRAGELPAGLMLSSLRGDDARLAAVAVAVEEALGLG